MAMNIKNLIACTSIALAISVSNTLAADDAYEFKGRETVLCLHNASSEELLIVVGEQFVINKRFSSRTIQSRPGKISCLRYDDLQFAWVEFTTSEKVAAGEQITANDLRGRPTCRRVKGGFAKYYNLDIDQNGRQSCKKDKRSSDEIRALVANAKPLTR
ncbi:MAG: hypothetical protein V3V30_06885 [Parvularculaceae bacterium]